MDQISLNSHFSFGGVSTREKYSASSTSLLSLPQPAPRRPLGCVWPTIVFVNSASAVTALPLATSTSVPSLQYVQAGELPIWTDQGQLRQWLLPTVPQEGPYPKFDVGGDEFLTRGITPSQDTRHSDRLESAEGSKPPPSYRNQTGRPHVAIGEPFTAGLRPTDTLEDRFSPAKAATSEHSAAQAVSSSDFETPITSRVSIFRRRLQGVGAKDHAAVQNRIPPELSVSQVWVQGSPQGYIQNASSVDKYNSRTKEAVSQLWMPLIQAKGWLQARSLHIGEELSLELRLLMDENQQVENLKRILESDRCVQSLIYTSVANSL